MNKIIIFIFTCLLTLICAKSFADSDIYPEGFVEDCKASYANAENRPINSDRYQARCSCISEFFFEQNFQDEAEIYYYGAFMTMIESNKQGSPYKLSASNFRIIRDSIRSCETKME